jgi:uncharacterized protein DUF4124
MKTGSRSQSLLVLALFCALAFVAAEGRAQAYKYKDANGHVHFTENIYEIPEKYRSQVETRDMPAHVDPNEAAKQGSNDAVVETSVEDTLRHGLGRDLTIKQQDMLHAWFEKWKWIALASLVVNTLIALAMVVHAFVSGHIGWGLANFFIGVSSPVYLMLHLEQPIAVRGGLLLLYLAPFVVLGMAMSELVSALS